MADEDETKLLSVIKQIDSELYDNGRKQGILDCIDILDGEIKSNNDVMSATMFCGNTERLIFLRRKLEDTKALLLALI